jgi:hypothetical protein
MDYESERSQKLGCWNAYPIGSALINEWTTSDAVPDFLMAEPYANLLIDFGLGKECDKAVRDFWVQTVQESYKGDDGRKRARMASINLRDRDSLHGRLFDVRCPVLWMHVSFALSPSLRCNIGHVLTRLFRERTMRSILPRMQKKKSRCLPTHQMRGCRLCRRVSISSALLIQRKSMKKSLRF